MDYNIKCSNLFINKLFAKYIVICYNFNIYSSEKLYKMINPEERRRILMQKIKKVHKGRVTAILVAAMLIVGAVLPSIADTADTFERTV